MVQLREPNHHSYLSFLFHYYIIIIEMSEHSTATDMQISPAPVAGAATAVNMNVDNEERNEEKQR